MSDAYDDMARAAAEHARRNEEEPMHPRFVLEVKDGSRVSMYFDWPRQEDIQAFARVMQLLVNNQLTHLLMHSVVSYGMQTDKVDQALQVQAAISMPLESADENDEPPLVPPTKAIISHARNEAN